MTEKTPKLTNMDIMIRGLMLLFLSVSANFVGELLPCNLQKLLTNSMFAKHYVLILLIYFTITYPDSIDYPPLVYLAKTIFIWILFLVFSKMSLRFSMVSLFLLGVVYFLHTLSTNHTLERYKKDICHKMKKFVVVILIILIIIGHSKYFMKQWKDHRKDWSYTKFIFGTTKCANN